MLAGKLPAPVNQLRYVERGLEVPVSSWVHHYHIIHMGCLRVCSEEL